MACGKRTKSGSCSHFQCPYPDATVHGYECVELVGGFCEVGEGCYEGCAHAWQAGTERAGLADTAFRGMNDGC